MDKERKRRRLWPWLVLGAIVLIVLVNIVGVVASGSGSSSSQGTNNTDGQAPADTPKPAYSADVTGKLPTIQYVGQTTDVSLTVKDTGSRLPHLVVDVGGCKDHWVLDSISSNKGSGQQTSGGDYYDFGPIGPGMTWHGTLTVTPKDAGNHDCDIGVYGDLDESTGIPNGDPLGLLKGAVAINP